MNSESSCKTITEILVLLFCSGMLITVQIFQDLGCWFLSDGTLVHQTLWEPLMYIRGENPNVPLETHPG